MVPVISLNFCKKEARNLSKFSLWRLLEVKGLSHMQVVSFRLSLDSEFILDSSGLVKIQEPLCFCWRE